MQYKKIHMKRLFTYSYKEWVTLNIKGISPRDILNDLRQWGKETSLAFLWQLEGIQNEYYPCRRFHGWITGLFLSVFPDVWQKEKRKECKGYEQPESQNI